jgi:2-C-methyl-D-erythritol 4-phosphate cytidylyltransferase
MKLPSILRLMGTNDGQQTIALKERASRLVGEKVRAAAYVVVHEALRPLLLPKVLHWIGPEDIAHETGCRWLTKTIQLKEENV